jgi:hypothetical protein
VEPKAKMIMMITITMEHEYKHGTVWGGKKERSQRGEEY